MFLGGVTPPLATTMFLGGVTPPLVNAHRCIELNNKGGVTPPLVTHIQQQTNIYGAPRAWGG